MIEHELIGRRGGASAGWTWTLLSWRPWSRASWSPPPPQKAGPLPQSPGTRSPNACVRPSVPASGVVHPRLLGVLRKQLAVDVFQVVGKSFNANACPHTKVTRVSFVQHAHLGPNDITPLSFQSMVLCTRALVCLRIHYLSPNASRIRCLSSNVGRQMSVVKCRSNKGRRPSYGASCASPVYLHFYNPVFTT